MAAAVAAAIESLLDELAQSVLTQKKEALSAFEEFYFRTKPKMTDAQIQVRSASDCMWKIPYE